MSERRNKGDRSPERRPAEGVRIIGAEEAQAALEAGEAAGRRPEDELRFGDVPPAPPGPRPAHRFPLPDSVDPASAVPRPPLAPRRREADEGPGLPAASGRPEELEVGPPASRPAPEPEWMAPQAPASVPGQGQLTWSADPVVPTDRPDPPDRAGREPAIRPGPGGWSAADRTTELGVPEAAVEPSPLAPPDEGITVMGGGTDLPHWTDPPTGEVPRILADDDPPSEGSEDDIEAWHALGGRGGTRWRDAGEDWDDVDEIGMLAGDEEPVGALDQTRSEHSDLYSFDEDFERVEAERTGAGPALADFEDEFDPEPVRARAAAPSSRARHVRTAPPRPTARPAGRGGPPTAGNGGEDLTSRVAVGIGLIVLLIIAYAIGAKALVALAAVILVAAAAEAYGMLQRSGFRPATLLGLVGVAGVTLGAYWQGLEALPLITVLVFAGSMMWYLLRIVEARPLANVAVTTMAFVWIGLLGSYAALMLRAPKGRGLLLGTVVVAVAADVGGFLVGRWIGSRPMAASISPSKTVEGFIGGLIAALVVGAIVGKEIAPWGGMKHGLALGLVVGLVAAAGDLFESMIKRDLGLKDSGTILPGHGGLLDRFDSIIVALPAAYYVAILFSILK